jgi:hypothetical protein
MRTYLTPSSLLWLLLLLISSALGQDPGMMAAQQAQMAAQAASQANLQMMQNAQQANQQAMQNAQSSALSSPPCSGCFAAKPKFSLKPGVYSTTLILKMKDSTRGAVMYYTTDGWTPTAASTRYTGPITINSTTNLQAIAISPIGGRSRVATAVYTLSGVSVTTPAMPVSVVPVNPAPTLSDSGKLLLARGTPVPLVFTSDVSSKTAEIGDKISVTLADDLKVGNVVLIKKGTSAVVTVTEVDGKGMMGTPGEVFFQADSLQADGVLVKLRGSAAKEGQYKVGKAIGLMFIPMVPAGVLVRGTDAEIRPGTVFTAQVDADTLLPPAN